MAFVLAACVFDWRGRRFSPAQRWSHKQSNNRLIQIDVDQHIIVAQSDRTSFQVPTTSKPTTSSADSG